MIIKSYTQFISEKVEIENTTTPDFGESYYSKFINGERKFFNIQDEDGHKVGEIEYGNVDNDTIEIVSIYVDPRERGKNYGYDAFKEIVRKLENPNVILKAAPSSRGFWRKLGFEPMAGHKDYFKLQST